jgi:hypothetical protein
MTNHLSDAQFQEFLNHQRIVDYSFGTGRDKYWTPYNSMTNQPTFEPVLLVANYNCYEMEWQTIYLYIEQVLHYDVPENFKLTVDQWHFLMSMARDKMNTKITQWEQWCKYLHVVMPLPDCDS